MKHAARYLLLVAMILLVGCGASPLVEIQTALSAVGEMQVKGQAAAEAAYQAEQEACAPPPGGDACVAKVRADWKPIKDASAALYAAYSVALATYQAAQASYVVTKSFNAASVTTALVKLLAAADAWRSALTSKGSAAPALAPPPAAAPTPGASPSSTSAPHP